jgi:hypothetical protein
MGILDGHLADFRQRRGVSGSPHEQPTRWEDDKMIFHSPWRTVDSHVRGVYVYNNTKAYIAHFQVFKLPVPARYIIMRKVSLSLGTARPPFVARRNFDRW